MMFMGGALVQHNLGTCPSLCLNPPASGQDNLILTTSWLVISLQRLLLLLLPLLPPLVCACVCVCVGLQILEYSESGLVGGLGRGIYLHVYIDRQWWKHALI